MRNEDKAEPHARRFQGLKVFAQNDIGCDIEVERCDREEEDSYHIMAVRDDAIERRRQEEEEVECKGRRKGASG